MDYLTDEPRVRRGADLSAVAQLRDTGILRAVPARPSGTHRDAHCPNVSQSVENERPLRGGRPMNLRIVLASVVVFALACGAQSQNLPTPEPVVVMVTATPAPIPSSTPIPEPTPTRTPTPTPTPKPDPTRTPAPAVTPTPTVPPSVTPEPLSALFDIPPERIQLIEGVMPTGDAVILVGCHTRTIATYAFAFTRDGTTPKTPGSKSVAEGIVVISGHFPRLAEGGCYEMAVRPSGLSLYTVGSFGVPRDQWSKMREYKLLHYRDATRPITRGDLARYR